MSHQYATLEDTVYFWFGANDTSGSGGDGATPVYDVRLGGAAAGAAPVLSGAATLLTHADYPAGAHEVAIAATAANGFAAGNTYGVFCTLLVDGQNPTGFVGSFHLGPAPANVTKWSGTPVATPDTAGYPKVTIKAGTGTGELNLGSGAVQLGNFSHGHANASLVLGTVTLSHASSTPLIIQTTGGDADCVRISPNGTGRGITGSGGNFTLDAVLALCTANTDMRGTDGANTVVPDAAGTAATLHGVTDGKIDSVKAKTDNLPASPAAVGSAMTLTAEERNSVATALLDLANGIETSKTVRQALRIIAAGVLGKISGAQTGTEVFKGLDGTTTRATVTVDANGNRTGVVYG